MTKLKSIIEKLTEAKKPYVVYLPDIKEYWITDGERFYDGIRWIAGAMKGDGFLSKKTAERWLKKM